MFLFYGLLPNKEKFDVTAYEFYLFNPFKGYELLGVLPERRKDPERIT